MAKAKIQAKDLADLKFQKNEAERKKVLFVEASFVVLFAVVADSIEALVVIPWLGGLITVPISIGILLWAWLRRLHGRFEVKIAVAQLMDFVFGAVFPIRTISLLIIIWLNNHVSKKNIERLDKVLHGRL